MNDIADLLREHNLRVTPQRRAILQAFRGAVDEHLSADEVISRASVAVPEIGRGTVYATLAEFAELGVLGSVGNPEPIRYETNVRRTTTSAAGCACGCLTSSWADADATPAAGWVHD